ncbi:MAG: four helix bundle protein [Candidatus Roizmanbacteria bacterium]
MSLEQTQIYKNRIYAEILDLLKFLKEVKYDATSKVIINQVTRSSTSIIANYIEGQSGVSKREFTNYLSISLKSANETKLWLTFLKDLQYMGQEQFNKHFEEISQIANILGASIKKLRAT